MPEVFHEGRGRPFESARGAYGRRALAVLLVIACGVAAGARTDLTLARKAALFDADLAERFMPFGDGQVVARRWLPTPEQPHVTYNMSDSAYLTGIYCAAQTWRHRATGDPDAARLAGAACTALGHLATVSGRRGLLARGASPMDAPWFDDGIWRTSPDGRHRWRGNVSSDQVDGLMFGVFVHVSGTDSPDVRARMAPFTGAIVDAVLGAGRRIVGYDGTPTRWGHYEPDYVRVREPMNALLLLQMVKVAHAVTGEPRYERAYRQLIDEGYARIGEGARLDDPPLRANHSDDVLIALALYPLLELEQDPAIRAHYLEAARRWYRGGEHPGVGVEANPFAGFLWRHWTGDPAGVAPGLGTLRRMPPRHEVEPGHHRGLPPALRLRLRAGAAGAGIGLRRRPAPHRSARPHVELPRAEPVPPGRRPHPLGAVRDPRARLPPELLVRPGPWPDRTLGVAPPDPSQAPGRRKYRRLRFADPC